MIRRYGDNTPVIKWIHEPGRPIRQLRGLKKLDESMSPQEFMKGYSENHIKLMRALYDSLVQRTDKKLELSLTLEKKYSEIKNSESYYLRCKVFFPGAHEKMYQLRGNILNTIHSMFPSTEIKTFYEKDIATTNIFQFQSQGRYRRRGVRKFLTKKAKLPKIFIEIKDKKTYDEIFDFLKTNFTTPVLESEFYIKRKYALDRKIYTDRATFKKPILNLELIALVCKMIGFQPDFSNEKITRAEDFFGL